ncbi:MAG: DUF1059 domain-containing protein [Thermoplasmataceae archaeon]
MASYHFRCRDTGMECPYEVSSKKAEDLIPLIAEHEKSDHGIDEISDDLKQKINGAIKRRFF